MQDFDFKNQIYLTFFLLKHIKGSREAAFDDLCILADVSKEISRCLSLHRCLVIGSYYLHS